MGIIAFLLTYWIIIIVVYEIRVFTIIIISTIITFNTCELDISSM